MGLLPKQGSVDRSGSSSSVRVSRIVRRTRRAGCFAEIESSNGRRYRRRRRSRRWNDLVGRRRPGDAIKLTIVRDGAEKEIEVTLGTIPEGIVGELSSEVIERRSKEASDDAKKEAPANDEEKPGDGAKEEKPKADAPRTGRFTDELAGHDHNYWAYVPESYDPSVAWGLMVWIHPAGDTMEATMIKHWQISL